MQAASFYFAAELYDNGVVTQLDEDDSKMKVGMRCEEVQAAYWTIFDNFLLYYYGTMSPDQVTSIRQTVADRHSWTDLSPLQQTCTASAESAYANRPLRLTDCHKASTS